MKAKMLWVILGVIVLLIGCSGLTNEEILANAINDFKELKSYQCRVEVEVIGNRGNQLYEIKQYYKAKDSFRLETLSPKHLEGKVVIIKDKRAKIYHPHIEESIIIDHFTQNHEEFMFLGDFLTWNYQEGMEIEEKSVQGQEYLLINRIIKEGNYYHHKQELWIEKKTKLPKYMKIYDKNGMIRIDISIFDLILNENLEDELFNI